MLAYDELRGSEGRRIWYRPPRHEAHTLFPGRAPRVCLRSRSYILQNISLGGIAAVSKELAEPGPEVGDVVPLEIQQGGLTIFESRARVCRARFGLRASRRGLRISIRTNVSSI